MKRTTYFYLSLLLISVISVSCSKDDDTPADMGDTAPLEAVVMENVSYGNHPEQIYDIYLPAERTSERTKTLVLIHGGGWSGGDKEDMNQFIAPLQLNHPNHAIVNINYILADANTPAFPNQFLDIQAVVEKLTADQEDLAISDQFGFIGASAGAHLSLMYDAVYDTNDQVKFVANIVGPSDFTDPFYAEDPTFPFALALLVDENAYPQGDYAEAVSPVHQVSNASSPTVMFYGNQDPLVPLTNGQTLNTAFTNAQVNHSFTVYEGGHGDDWSTQDGANMSVQISEYINTYLSVD